MVSLTHWVVGRLISIYAGLVASHHIALISIILFSFWMLLLGLLAIGMLMNPACETQKAAIVSASVGLGEEWKNEQMDMLDCASCEPCTAIALYFSSCPLLAFFFATLCPPG